jgi:hypothetical protein
MTVLYYFIYSTAAGSDRKSRSAVRDRRAAVLLYIAYIDYTRIASRRCPVVTDISAQRIQRT